MRSRQDTDRPTTWWQLLLAVTLTLSLVATACGDDDDDSGATQSGDGPTATSDADGGNAADGDSASGDGSSEEPDATPADDGEADDGTDGDGDGMAAGACTADSPRGSLTMGTFTEPLSLDPIAATSGRTGAIELAAVYGALMQFNTETGAYEPRLAESLEGNDDGTEWTLTLRDGIKFGNGDPMTAEAVKASVERHQTEDARLESLATMITEIEVLDDLTVVFRLDTGWGGFPYMLAGPIGMIANPAVIDELGAEEFARNPVGAGAGAFEPVRFAPEEEIVLQGKTDYWDGPVCLDELSFITISGADATYESFDLGEIGVAFVQDPVVAQEVRDAGQNNVASLLGATGVVLMNAGAGDGTAPTTDDRLREAIALAIDPQNIDDRINDGLGQPTTAVLPPGSAYGDLGGYEPDPEQAQQLVQDVMDDTDWDGTLSMVCLDDPERVDTSIALEAQLEAAGMEIELENVDVSTLIQRVITDKNFELACWAFSISDAAPWVTLEAFRTESSSNRGGFSSEAMDAAVDQLRTAEGPDEVKAALTAVQEAWNEGIPAAIYAGSEDMIVWADDVQGLEFSQESIVFFDDAVVGG